MAFVLKVFLSWNLRVILLKKSVDSADEAHKFTPIPFLYLFYHFMVAKMVDSCGGAGFETHNVRGCLFGLIVVVSIH